MAGQEHGFYRGWPAAFFFFGIALFVCYWPGISGAATSPRWALLAVGVIPALAMAPVRVTMLHIIGAAFVVWAFASYLWIAAPLDSVGALWKLAIVACVFCVGSQCDDLKPFVFGAMLGLIVSGVIGSLQVSDIAQMPDVVPYHATGLFANRLMMAEAAALIGTALMAMREGILCCFIAPAIFLPCERGPILAFAFSSAIFLWRESKIASVSFAICGILIVSAITSGLTFNEPPDAKDSQTRIESASARLVIWQSILPEISLAGTGYGSFRAAAPQAIEGATIEHAHNEFLEIAFETGWIGLTLFIGVFVGAIYAAPLSIEGAVLLALMMEACFAFPLHEPTTAALGALCAGRCASRLPRVVDALTDCRVFLYGRLAQCL